MPTEKPRVFLSHSSADKDFVRKLKADLEAADLAVWFDATEIRVGDSIPAKISEGLTDTDYLVVVLSDNSVQSPWVQAELDAALMAQWSGRGIIVLPIVIGDCEIPELLKPLLYADFRGDYQAGLKKLIEALGQESPPPSDEDPPSTSDDDCPTRLGKLSDAELRRLILSLDDRVAVETLWADSLNGSMQTTLGQVDLRLGVLELIRRTAKDRDARARLIDSLCQDHINP